MRNFIKKSLLGVAALFLFTISANAQLTINTNVGVTARLAEQISVTKVFDVDFGGIFIPKGTDVVATMDYLGTVSITTGTTGLFATNLQQVGVVRIFSNQTATFSIQYPDKVNLTFDNNSLVYTPKVYSKTGTYMPSSLTTMYDLNTDEISNGSAYSKVLNIAGTLDIPTTAKAGIYTGNVDITIIWQ